MKNKKEKHSFASIFFSIFAILVICIGAYVAILLNFKNSEKATGNTETAEKNIVNSNEENNFSENDYTKFMANYWSNIEKYMKYDDSQEFYTEYKIMESGTIYKGNQACDFSVYLDDENNAYVSDGKNEIALSKDIVNLYVFNKESSAEIILQRFDGSIDIIYIESDFFKNQTYAIKERNDLKNIISVVPCSVTDYKDGNKDQESAEYLFIDINGNIYE